MTYPTDISVTTDPRLVAMFFKYPEAFQRWRNANWDFWDGLLENPGEVDEARVSHHQAMRAIITLGGEKMRPLIELLERVWDAVDEAEYKKLSKG